MRARPGSRPGPGEAGGQTRPAACAIGVEEPPDERVLAAVTHPANHMRGWRPTGDCFSSRPDAATLRAAPHKTRTKGAT